MKKILLLSACACMLLASCNDFLEENPKSMLTLKDMYKTESQALESVNSMYRGGALSSLTSAGSAYVGPFASINQMMTGYFFNSYEGQEIVCKYARELTRQNQTNTVSSTVDGVWDGCFSMINRANAVIKYVPNINMDESTKKQYLAEAKFFRAFNYFYLVKIFGDVPLLTEPSENVSSLQVARDAASSVYTQIETDLKDAISALPAATFAGNGHRITKYVAEQTLASVLMMEGRYSDAVTYLNDIINSKKFELTTNDDMALGSAYNKLRTTDDLSEVIYAYEFNNNISTSGWWPTYAFSSSATGVFDKYSIFERVYGPSERFLNVYETNDLRIQEKQFFAMSYTNSVNGKEWNAPDREHIGCWYFFDQNADEVTGKGTKDVNIYRYAETLLDAAECIAQSSGVNDAAANYLAQVQARANMEGKTAAQLAASLKSLSKEQFIQACWTERLREFPLEFKIWDDCLRTKMFPEISETTPGQVSYVALIGAKNASGATFKQSDLLWPVSVNEIQRNPSLLPQNEGYSEK